MKKRSVMSLVLAASTVFTFFGTVFADSPTSGQFKMNEGYYKWNYETSSKTLNISKGSSSGFQDSRYDKDTAKEAVKMNISGIQPLPGGQNEYSYYIYPYDMPALKEITFTGTCEVVKNLHVCTNLSKITFSANSAKWVELDFSRNYLVTLPKILCDTSDTKFNLNISDTRTANITVPAQYGSDSRIEYSFKKSSDIENVTFEKGTKCIPDEAFYDCEKLNSVSIPTGVTTIEYSAFAKCKNLTSVTIPSTITRIRHNAFEGSGVKDIYYDGTRSKWYGLVQQWDDDGPINGANVLYLDGTVVHCNDGDVLIRFDEKETRYYYRYYQNWFGWSKESNGKWKYYNDNGGSSYGCMQVIDGKTYGFDKNGYMITGWAQFDNNWYFFNKSGVMQTGWVQSNGYWYYLNNKGIMQTGWLLDVGKWYYLNPNGDMATYWKQIEDVWYYFGSNGQMVTGWKKIDGYYFYFKTNGSMAANEYCGGYRLDADGRWTYTYKASWKKDSKGWWYGDSNGWYAKNQTLKIDGKNYNFDKSGYCTNP